MSPKRFFYLLCVGLIIIVLAGGAAYYYASLLLANGTHTLSQDLASESLANQQLSQLEDLRQEYQRLQPLLPAIYDALPNQKDQSTIALQLHNIAAASGMNLDSLSFTPTAIPGPTSQTIAAGSALAIPISFELHGNYAQLQQFLQLQENLNRYTNITSLSISGGGNSLSFAINLEAFMKP